mgnify:CR=1 FL=1
MSFSKEAAVGFFVMLGLVCVAYLTVKLGRMEVFHSEGYVLTASFNSVSGLRGGRDRRRPRRAGQVHPAG